MNTVSNVYLQGLLTSLGLIVAIGAQNAFVLRQGLRREHIGTVVVWCAAADAVLIAAGVFGMAQLIASLPGLSSAMAWVGAVFLWVYGAQALRRTRRPSTLSAQVSGQGASRTHVLAQAVAFTLLNPHVYLDTVLLVGSMGAQHAPTLQGWFVLGASSASVMWFGALGFGSRWLAPFFAHPRAWQWLDGMVGLTMWGMAALMVRHALS